MALRKVKITLVEMGEQQGVDGKEPQYTSVGTAYADYERINGFKDLSAGRMEMDEAVRFTFLTDTSYSINAKTIIEFENRQYTLTEIQKGDYVDSKFAFNPVGRYWRVTGRSRDFYG